MNDKLNWKKQRLNEWHQVTALTLLELRRHSGFKPFRKTIRALNTPRRIEK